MGRGRGLRGGGLVGVGVVLPFAASGFGDGDGGCDGDVEGADSAGLGDVGGGVGCGEEGWGAAVVFGADGEADVAGEGGVVEGEGVAGEFDGDDVVAVGACGGDGFAGGGEFLPVDFGVGAEGGFADLGVFGGDGVSGEPDGVDA